jgi:hypothetical protein
MFFEYALDPALLTNWKDCRYFVEKFGWPHGRLISRYPKKWKRLVYEALSGCGEVEIKRIVERLKQIDDRLVKRPNSEYDGNKSWLENAVDEHGRLAFRAIISREHITQSKKVINHVTLSEAKGLDSSPPAAAQNDNECNQFKAPSNNYNLQNLPYILDGDNLDENEPLWQSPNRVVNRKAKEYTAALDLLLLSSKEIKFIDPYFDPQKLRFRGVLEEMLNYCYFNHRREKEFKPELHISTKRAYKKPEFEQSFIEHLIKECKEKLPKCIPADVNLVLFIWKERPGGEMLHNRYVLTEKGGVIFGSGLDECDGDSEATDDLNRLSKEQYSDRWKQYSIGSSAFDLIGGPIEIVGTKCQKRRGEDTNRQC